MPPTVALRFKLKVSGTDAFEDFQAVSVSARYTGTLRLDGDTLTIAWGGVATVQEVGALSIRGSCCRPANERRS